MQQALAQFSNTPPAKIVLLTTGGTIAGWASDQGSQQHYQAGVLSGADLLATLPRLPCAVDIAIDPICNIDSKDAGPALWLALHARIMHWLAQDGVAGIVVTHGTDTLEESSYFLSQTLPALCKPVVLTCAMRPASHPQADGPQNLHDALLLATQAACADYGVLLVCGGQIHSGALLQKLYMDRLMPFISRNGDALGWIESDTIQWAQNHYQKSILGNQNERKQLLNSKHIQSFKTENWPRVELVHSHAGASAAVVDALIAQHQNGEPLFGIVAVGTGNATLHHDVEQALVRAQDAGIRVARASTCLGLLQPAPDDVLMCFPTLSPKQARIQLQLLRLCEM